MFNRLKLRYSAPPPTVFVIYEGRKVAELTKDDKGFVFAYRPDFSSLGLSPLPGFPSVDPRKRYRSRELWPFFAQRIPDQRRPEVQRLMTQLGLTDATDLRLLGTLGAHSVTDPYELQIDQTAA